MNAADVLVLLAYSSLVVELVLFPIPSEASTWQLLAAPVGDGSDALARARRRALATKVLLFVLPTAIGIAMFLLPLACIVFAPVRRELADLAGPVTTATGLVFVVAGRALTLVSVLQLRAQRRRPAFAPAGLFAWSRNPGLIGMYAFYIGLCLVAGVSLMWIVLPLYLHNMHQRVAIEEAHLHARLGDAWGGYCARVPRYLPLPGLR